MNIRIELINTHRFSSEVPILADLTLKGRIICKKNSQSFGKVGGRIMCFGNPAYNRTKKAYSESLRDQYQGPTIAEPITLWLKIWVRREGWFLEHLKNLVPKTFAGTDIDNVANSICDLLKLSGVIMDDCLVMSIVAEKQFGKMPHGDYGAEIRITKFDPMVWG